MIDRFRSDVKNDKTIDSGKKKVDFAQLVKFVSCKLTFFLLYVLSSKTLTHRFLSESTLPTDEEGSEFVIEEESFCDEPPIVTLRNERSRASRQGSTILKITKNCRTLSSEFAAKHLISISLYSVFSVARSIETLSLLKKVDKPIRAFRC